MNTRAQAIGVNTIIIAAIALVVLAIIAFLVVDSGILVTEGLQTCSAQGGTCIEAGAEPPQGYIADNELECQTPGYTCYTLPQ